MSFGGPNTRSLFITPPLKGSFPLDHDGVCGSFVKEYLECLKKSRRVLAQEDDNDNAKVSDQDICREWIKEYFDCRMRNGLMEREEWARLGI